MGFRVPTFNLIANLWYNPNVPPAAPDATTICQLRCPGKQTVTTVDLSGLSPSPLWELLVPAGTDVRTYAQTGTLGSGAVECPAGSGRYYVIFWADDVAKGFANEYRVAYLFQTAIYGFWPTPMP